MDKNISNKLDLFPITTNYVYHKGKLLNTFTNKSFKDIEKMLQDFNKLVKKNENKIEIVKVVHNPNSRYVTLDVSCKIYTLNADMKLQHEPDDYTIDFTYSKKEIADHKITPTIISRALKQAARINKIIPIGVEHVYYKNKRIDGLFAKNMDDLQTLISKKIKKSNEKKKIFVVRVSCHPSFTSNVLTVHFSSYTLNEDLTLSNNIRDTIIVIGYNNEELKKYKFKLVHIQIFLNAIENRLIDLSKDSVNVSKILK